MHRVHVTAEFLDGSFVTSREDPADVDASYWIQAADLNGLSASDLAEVENLFHRARSSFRVDAYMVPECGQQDAAWLAFDHVRKWTRKYWKTYKDPNKVVVPGAEKGYLKVIQ